MPGVGQGGASDGCCHLIPDLLFPSGAVVGSPRAVQGYRVVTRSPPSAGRATLASAACGPAAVQGHREPPATACHRPDGLGAPVEPWSACSLSPLPGAQASIGSNRHPGRAGCRCLERKPSGRRRGDGRPAFRRNLQASSAAAGIEQRPGTRIRMALPDAGAMFDDRRREYPIRCADPEGSVRSRRFAKMNSGGLEREVLVSQVAGYSGATQANDVGNGLGVKCYPCSRKDLVQQEQADNQRLCQ